MLLHIMAVGYQCPTVDDIISSPLAWHITIDAEGYGCGGMAYFFIVNYVHPLFLKAKSAASGEDNLNCRETTTEVFSDNYWKGMKVNIANLESMCAWEIVDQNDSINAIDSTWVFKCKRYPDGLIKKFKA